MDSQELLRSAVQAARRGQRQSARALFLDVLKQDPQCETAWLWLSDLLDERAQRIHALEKALEIQPTNRAAQARLAQLRALPAEPRSNGAAPVALLAADQEDAVQITSDAAQPFIVRVPLANDHLVQGAAPDDPDWRTPSTDGSTASAFQQAIRLAKAGQRESALNLLKQLVEIYPERADAWLWIGQLAHAPAEKIAAFQQVLALQPRNHAVRTRLRRLEDLERKPLLLGEQHEERGEREQARSVYQWITIRSRIPAERLEAARRLINLQLLGEAEELHTVSPTITVVRLTLGPVVLFTLLILFQDGLNPLHLSLFSLLCEASVLIGSLLVTVTGLKPMHPLWVQRFGRPGTVRELEMRSSLRLSGWLLLTAPFGLYFMESLRRMAVLLARFYS